MIFSRKRMAMVALGVVPLTAFFLYLVYFEFGARGCRPIVEACATLGIGTDSKEPRAIFTNCIAPALQQGHIMGIEFGDATIAACHRALEKRQRFGPSRHN